MTLIFQKLCVFLKKGFFMEVSYKTNFFLVFFNTLFQVFIFYFVGRMMGAAALPYLDQYGGDYFAFVLIGISFASYSWTSVNSLSDWVRNEQMMGTLEAILSTPTRMSTLMVFSTLWHFVYTTVKVLICFAAGVLLFGFSFEGANILGALLIILLTVSSLIGLGMASAGVTLIIKKGNPIGVLFSMFSDILSGVYFPLTVLPFWLKGFSAFIPLTYSLKALRLVILKGYTIRQVLPEVFALIGFSVILIPVGFLVVHYSLRKAKIDGSLIQY